MFTCCLILYIIDNLVSNGIQKIRFSGFLYNIRKVHNLGGVGQTTGMVVVLFWISLS